MRAASLLFLRLIVRPLLREPARTGLTVFAVALGVAVVIAIDLAGQAAVGSFHSSLESLAGKADFTITATGGLDERLLGRLVQLPYAFEFAPRIENFASINGRGETLPFIGVDLVGHAPVGPWDRGDEIVAPVWVPRRLGLRVGERVTLLINDQMHAFTVAGNVASDAIVTDIGIAQKAAGKAGKLDSVEVKIPPGGGDDHWLGVLKRELPGYVSITPQGARTDENRKMLAAFRWNLQVLSYIALIVGGFLIYNTISISVVRRRTEIGILRALGATRAWVRAGFLAEACSFGIFGSVLGVVFGRVMAQGAVKLVGSTVQSLYVSSRPSPLHLQAENWWAGLGMGLVVSILAALAPASEASQIAPVEAMARGREEYVAARRSRRTIFAAAGMFLLAGVLAKLPPVNRQPIFAYAAAMLLVAGTSLIVPNLVNLFAEATHSALKRIFGVEALLALRSLHASIRRTSILTAALATAVAMMASVGIMVGSFRETVWLWMNNQLRADFYLRPAAPGGADRYPTMSATVADEIAKLPGVAAVDRFREYAISYEGLPASLAGGETSTVASTSAIRFLPGENRTAILGRLPTGDFAVVSEPFANKHAVRVGSRIRLALPAGMHAFEVLGIYYDYSSERGLVVLDRRTLLKYLPDPELSSLAVFLKPGASVEAVRGGIDRAIGGRAIVAVQNSKLREAGIAVFDRTFRITYALEAVAVAVAVLGIAGALLAMVIDRRREFALLRFLGTSQPQLRRIILSEAGLLGLLANGIGLCLGVVLSLILIFVINKQSFGWTIQFHLPVALLIAALTGIYAATVLAGFYPARRAMRLSPIEAIHEE